MPHINRIRVNNVKYNFGTQYYDDFIMRFSCRNTIYDLANGGGKSVLMLLLLQNLIPNCTLDEKQPIEKLFRTADGSKTIHSLIEWRLSDVHVKNNYKYMLTGFCARKAKDDTSAMEGEENTGLQPGIVKENASIEYFNYVIFYREFNDNDIKNLPLNNGRERITYNGLKAYLRELERKDLSLEIKIFERKGEYQRFIAQYGLYESEWEIIRGINKTEGHVRTYFETNYKTTRKVVEDLLIEEIIQKSFASQTESEGEGEYMAKTLLDIKDKLLELADKKEDIQSFDRQIEVIEGFAGRAQNIKQLYFGREDITGDIAKCYLTLKAMISGNEHKKEELAEREELLNKERRETERIVESVGIHDKELEADKLGREIEELINEQGIASMELKDLNDELTLRESINDYADYVYYKSQRDETRELIEASLKDKGQILADVTELAGQVYENINKQREHIISQIEKEEKIHDMEKALEEELYESASKCSSEMAVSEYLMSEAKNRDEELNKSINSLRSALELYMVTDVDREVKQCEDSIRSLKEQQEHTVRAREEATFKQSEAEHTFRDIAAQIEQAERELSENIDERTRLEEIEAKASKLMEIYGENIPKRLAEEIKLRSREAYLEEESLKNEADRQSLYLEQLRTGCPVGHGEEVIKVYDYISKFHGAVVIYGTEYLRKKTLHEKERILAIAPILPYSIVISKDYDVIVSDAGLKELELGDYAVPLVSLEVLEAGHDIMSQSGLMFVMKNENLYTDEKALEKELKRTERRLEDIYFRLERLEGKASVLEQDYDFAREYETVYSVKMTECMENSERLRYVLKELEAKREDLQRGILEAKKAGAELMEAEEQLIEALRQAGERSAALKELKELMNESRSVADRLAQSESSYRRAIKDKSDVEARLEAGRKQADEREKHIQALKKQREQLEENWNNYKKYYKEGTYPVSYLSEAEMEARLKGLIRALESGATDISDKQKLVENYDIAMEKSLQAIDYKGLFVDDVRAKYEALEMTETSKEELFAIKQSIERAKSKIDSYAINISKLRSRKDRLEGAVVHGKAAMVEKYGEYTEHELPAGDYQAYAEEKKNQGKAIGEELERIRHELIEIQKSEGRYAVLDKDMSKVIERAGIAVPESMSELDLRMSEADFEQRINDVLDRFDKYTRDTADRRQEFEHDRQLLSDTLRRLGAEALADEINRSSIMPANLTETDELIESLKDICRCLELEKERVGKSIDDMERIKDNFENQCIQTCVNIRNELDRLPKQSKINMDGETISIISLAIPYVKEEQYKLRMSQYIDETTRMADEMKSEAERIKYIRNRLAWKKLFSVIVTDMSSIRLNLYKRERIREQSRYLRYEEAVGSTGQSQGIYIQFLIAIINYIASINSKDKDTGLRKVIFIDNPFGAAKDIYIWEPIFKLLKTNNVQLIVPARGVTPAITGHFDVNYILGQRLIDGRQQTVVVDYSSHVDSEKMDYSKLEFEQTSLF